MKKLKGLVVNIIEEYGSLNNEALTKAMIELRNTPGPFGKGPATIVYGHDLRSMIPTIGLRAKQYEKQKNYYNRGAHNMKPLEVSEKVIIQHEDTKRWDRTGIVIQSGTL